MSLTCFLDLPPKTVHHKMLVFCQNNQGGFCHEDIEVHRGADRICPQASRIGNTDQGGDPEDGYRRADLLPVEEEIGRLGTHELRRLKQLEEENRRLKQIVADFSLDKHMLQEVPPKKALKPSRKRELATLNKANHFSNNIFPSITGSLPYNPQKRAACVVP